MAELPPVNPPERGVAPEEPSLASGLLKATATIGVLAAAAAGSRVLLKALPESVRIAAQAKIARWGLSTIRSVENHPSLGLLNRAFRDHPGNNEPVLERVLGDVSQRNFGLLNALETISRMQAPDLMMQENIARSLLMDYDLSIPQLQDGAWRRATLDDMWRAITAGHVKLPNTSLTKDVDLTDTAYKLGMDLSDLRGLRLDPYLMFNESTGKLADLSKLNLPGRLADWAEDAHILGIPFFRLRPDRRGDKFGMALFGRVGTGPDETSHPMVKMITGEDRGQLFVMKDQAWFRRDASDPFRLMNEASGKWTITSDYKLAEMGLRAAAPTTQFDELLYGRRTGSSIRDAIGFGPEFVPQGQHSILGRATTWDKEKLRHEGGLFSWLKTKAIELDPTGILGSGSTRPARAGFGVRTGLLQSSDGGPGHLYLRRTGFAGVSDWLNVQASRPTYIINQLGLGMRPGRGPLRTLGKMSALAAGAYMGKEALSYMDWATGNIASTAAGKVAGSAHYIRQAALEAAGATDAAASLEDETPGLLSSPLSQALRFSALALGGAAIGKATGGTALMQKLVAGVARRGIGRTGLGKHVARNIVSNIGLQSGSGAIGGLVLGGAAGAATLGDPSRPAHEILEEMRGDRQVEYRASAGWMLGRDPFAGGRIRFNRPSTYHSLGTDYTSIGVYGSEGDKWRYGSWLPTAQNWLGLRRLFNPYVAEERNAMTRPYPSTGGHFGEYPIFGPALEASIGRLLKPNRGIDTLAGSQQMNLAASGGAYYTGDVRGTGAVSAAQMSHMGYLPAGLAPGVAGSGNAALAFANLSRNIQEYSGLRGFQTQFISQFLTGSQHPGLETPVLASSSKMTSVSRSYYDKEPGGLLGMTEALRRFVVRPSGQPEVNTIPNSLPRWLPGSMSMFEKDRKFYVDLSRGDPYTKIPLGEARLPGPGRDSLYQKHGGASYDVVDSFMILADVAPFTDAYRIMKMEVERLIRQGKLEPEWINRYLMATAQAEKKSNFRVFHSNRFREHTKFTIEEVLGPTKFRVRERPGEIFNLEGTQLDYSEPISLIAQRQARGMSASEATASVRADKEKLKRRLESLRGRTVAMDLTGGANVRIPGLDEELRSMGVVQEDDLYDQGAVGKMYTAAGKNVGELGFLAGLAYGIIRGGKSPAARVAGAIMPAAGAGIVGGWAENKFTGDFTAVEHYKRFQVYGSTFADWMHPVHSFIRPWANSALSTVVDFTPSHRKEQYDIEQYFDNLKYVKYTQLAKEAGKSNAAMAQQEYEQMARATLVGMNYANLTASTPGLVDAIPANERAYLKQFAAETDPAERARIIESVPDYMKAVYLSIWNTEDKLDGDLAIAYNRHVVPLIESSPYERASAFFEERGAPSPTWMGWHPTTNLSDVKYRVIQLAGGSPHDHGLFSSEERKINAFTPWVTQAADEIVNQAEGPLMDVGNIRKTWRRMTVDGVINTLGRSDAHQRNDVRLYADNSDRYNEFYINRAMGEVGIY